MSGALYRHGITGGLAMHLRVPATGRPAQKRPQAVFLKKD
jgi:hypothetical protein